MNYVLHCVYGHRYRMLKYIKCSITSVFSCVHKRLFLLKADVNLFLNTWTTLYNIFLKSVNLENISFFRVSNGEECILESYVTQKILLNIYVRGYIIYSQIKIHFHFLCSHRSTISGSGSLCYFAFYSMGPFFELRLSNDDHWLHEEHMNTGYIILK